MLFETLKFHRRTLGEARDVKKARLPINKMPDPTCVQPQNVRDLIEEGVGHVVRFSGSTVAATN